MHLDSSFQEDVETAGQTDLKELDGSIEASRGDGHDDGCFDELLIDRISNQRGIDLRDVELLRFFGNGPFQFLGELVIAHSVSLCKKGHGLVGPTGLSNDQKIIFLKDLRRLRKLVQDL